MAITQDEKNAEVRKTGERFYTVEGIAFTETQFAIAFMVEKKKDSVIGELGLDVKGKTSKEMSSVYNRLNSILKELKKGQEEKGNKEIVKALKWLDPVGQRGRTKIASDTKKLAGIFGGNGKG